MSWVAALGLTAIITVATAFFLRWSWWRAYGDARCLENGICPRCGTENLMRDSQPIVFSINSYRPIFRCLDCQNHFPVPKAHIAQRVRKALVAKVDERLTQVLERDDERPQEKH